MFEIKQSFAKYRKCFANVLQNIKFVQSPKPFRHGHIKLLHQSIKKSEHATIRAYFNNKQYSPNTTGKHIKSLKEIMAASREEGLHTNFQTLQKGFKIMSCESDTIYLTHKEIEAIEKLDLSAPKDAQLDICRDIFLVGVETLQRYSDYHRINKENIITLPNKTKAITLPNKTKAITLRQQKTNAKVVIPCTPRLTRILAKYRNELPRTYSQMLNDNIKLICLQAKITQKIEHTTIKGAKRQTQIIPKYTLVTTHTARRTGATLLYLDGMDLLSIMKFTGHQTETEFLKYIRVTAEENAIRFSLENPLKVVPLIHSNLCYNNRFATLA